MAGLESTVDMFDLRMSDDARPLYDRVKKFIAEEIEPNTAEFFRLGEDRAERWGYGEGQLDLPAQLFVPLVLAHQAGAGQMLARQDLAQLGADLVHGLLHFANRLLHHDVGSCILQDIH